MAGVEVESDQSLTLVPRVASEFELVARRRLRVCRRTFSRQY